MALLSKKEFSEVCGMATKDLAVYVKRTKVIVNSHGFIDTNDEVNKSFMEKRKGKVEERSLPEAIKNTQRLIPVPEFGDIPEGTDISEIVSLPNQTYVESERQKKYFETIKIRNEIDKLKLDNSKKRGEVIPSELIKPVFLQHNQSIITEFKNGTDEILRSFAKKKGLTVNETAEIKGEMSAIINDSMNKAILATIKSVEAIVQEHADKKGVGQRT
jgi:hypothetical protein